VKLELPPLRGRLGAARNESMKNTLVVVAGLSCYKAFKLENHHPDRPPRLELLEQFDNPEAHSHLVDKVSDLSGRFPSGTIGGSMSDGERHNIQLETRKRLVRQLAQRLNAIARHPEIESCFLAASKEINHLLMAELEAQVRAKVAKNVPADLTKLERGEILNRF
jgi:hypothetical protein